MDAAVLGFADVFGIGGGAGTTGAAGVDGVGFGFVGTEREEHLRGLRELRDGNRLRHDGTPRRIG